MELAKELVKFMDGFNHWELLDAYGGIEEAEICVEQELKRKDTRSGIRNYLREVAEDTSNYFEDRIVAAKLCAKIGKGGN